MNGEMVEPVVINQLVLYLNIERNQRGKYMDYNFLNNVNDQIQRDWEVWELLNSNKPIAKLSRKIDKILENWENNREREE